MRVYIITLLLFFFHEAVFSQPKKDQLFSLSENEWNYSTSLLRELLAIPNDASYEEHVAQNVDWCTKAFTKLGFDIHLLSTDKVPLLLAERKVKKAKKTVLFYLQIDGQPVDTSHWQQESPYLPVLKQRTANGTWEAIDWKNVTDAYNPEYRVFARSASDAKGPVAMFLTALSIMEKQKWQANYNIKVIMDFEEELGSPHLPGAVVQYKDLLSADMLVILDGPRHITNQPTLTFGARGIATIALTVFGPRVPQ
ncbi:MAG: M20/M25/M40 family metallo-hydrolase, partial [Cyclobacteriaceae bacterium]|nr:M20/M25/M40 family metallo-hydrolase [Cyclobacteriaceae bacterium]